MNQAKLDGTLLWIIRLGTFLCFAGWTWVHFYWEAPYGVLLWQDSTFWLADQFGVHWDAFVGSGGNDGLIQKWIARIWWLYFACAIVTLTAGKRSWFRMMGLLGGSGLLIILSYAKYVAAQRQAPEFFEHGGQMLIPVVLVSALALGIRHRFTIVTAITAFLTTFAGHGSYAVGLWPTPPTFYGMTTVILGVEYETAVLMLRVAGVLDFVICIGIFVPCLRRASALYGVVWGFLTAIARPVAGMSWDLNYWGADQYLHEAVLRAPHFMLPLYLFVLSFKPKVTAASSEVVEPA